MSKSVVISLGGSLIVPEAIDTTFLKEFRSFVYEYLEKGYSLALICGGGKTARVYQQAAQEIGQEDHATLDWIGIEATKLNAFFVHSLFTDVAHETIVTDPTQPIDAEKKLVIASGWEPGKSTDFDAVHIAKQLGADHVINMSNIDYVYDSDPKKNKDAQPVKQMSWDEYRKMVGDEWIPGFNSPFDPIASKLAQESGISAVIVGKDIENVKQYLEGNSFKGTVIQ